MPAQLYLPEKYSVFTGAGHVGLCTVWNDPEIILKTQPDILNHVALLGTLYSREGVNIILRNLCLNPEIHYVLIWGKGNLSRTPIGLVGRDLLEKIWAQGIENDGSLHGTNFSIHPNMDVNVVRKVVQNVKLIDVSEDALHQIVEKIGALEKKSKYMEPAPFPEYKRSSDARLPSEEVGFVVRGKKISEAWTKTIDKIMRYGTIKKTEYGNNQRELHALTWVIENEDASNPYYPDWPDDLKKVVGFDRDSLSKYIQSIFFDAALPEGTAYTYGNRLLAYPSAEGAGINQTQFMIDKIKECEVSRRAVSVLFNPTQDEKSKSPPCLTHLQILVNDGRLNMFVVYRSHDIFKAGISNAFGLRALQAHIAKETRHEVGKLAITSNSAHIYEEDWENAKKFCMCEIWERAPKLAYDELNESDPRGSVVISIIKDRINADVMSPQGEPLMSVEGASGKEVMKKLAQMDLLLRPDHLMDIGMELQKAEIARVKGIKYSQDKALEL